MAFTVPYNLLGFWVQGDLGGVSIYTDRFGKKVWYPKAPPHKPPSEKQLAHRQRFRLAQAAWKALTADQKATLELATNRASLCLTGQNLYIGTALRNLQGPYETIGRQTGLTLPAAPFIP